MAAPPNVRLNVMVSSTIVDLPEHRQEILKACLRQGMFPLMMEHEPASYADPIAFSLDLVNRADIYVGIYGNRYGFIPVGQKLSLTEMEYNRAIKRGIPRLIFMMDKDHPIKIVDVDTGEPAVKLKAFKDSVEAENFVNFFRSPSDLRAEAVNSLSYHRQSDPSVFHFVSEIPAPPEPYIAHPYTLLQSKGLIGRSNELNLLTDWVSKSGTEVYQNRLLHIIAMGGMGKSALTWKWFNDIAPQEMKPLAGRMWWSFYESDASFENFVTRALAYVSGYARHEVEKMSPLDREEQLLAILGREPFLLVLDGLERILLAYASQDAIRRDDKDLDEGMPKDVAGATGLPAGAGESFTGKHRLRKATDPRAGSFLRKLANVRSSRILVSTRLYPADLQASNGQTVSGSFVYFLGGLQKDDAISLWREFKVSGSREELLRLFETFENHPLLLQSLATEVALFRRAPGDFDKWREAHPDFNPFNLPLVQVRSHVLAFALRGLESFTRKLLHTVAAFRMPTTYETLSALMKSDNKRLVDDKELDAALTELEDRGLIGWDRRANRYDSHPVVRGIAWAGLGGDTKQNIYINLEAHFRSLPYARDWRHVRSLEELTPAIELYNTLIGLHHYEEAFTVYRDHVEDAALYTLNAGRQSVELLEMLFPHGLDKLPYLKNSVEQAWTLNSLALSYRFSGRPLQAIPLHKKSAAILKKLNQMNALGDNLNNLADALRLCGSLRDSETAARKGYVVSTEAGYAARMSTTLAYLGLVLALRGIFSEAETVLHSALELSLATTAYRPYDYLSLCALLRQDFSAALKWAGRAIDNCAHLSYPRGSISASRVRGVAALGLNRLKEADQYLHHALTEARRVDLIEEEILVLIALADLRRRQAALKSARELLEDVWELAERGSYRLFLVDALNVLAQIERDAGADDAAAQAATKAYRLAWCDGPPFAYHSGLHIAAEHLDRLSRRKPDGLPPFDESKFDRMPNVNVKQRDSIQGNNEFWTE